MGPAVIRLPDRIEYTFLSVQYLSAGRAFQGAEPARFSHIPGFRTLTGHQHHGRSYCCTPDASLFGHGTIGSLDDHQLGHRVPWIFGPRHQQRSTEWDSHSAWQGRPSTGEAICFKHILPSDCDCACSWGWLCYRLPVDSLGVLLPGSLRADNG